MIIRTVLFALGSVALAASASAADAPVYIPVKPVDLLAVLPPVPTNWKLTRSEAEASFGNWYSTRASRTFEGPPDASGKSAGRVDLSVTDTGAHPPAIAAFANFKAEKQAGWEKVFLGSVPAIQFAGANGERNTQALVNQRYLVEIQLSGLPQHTADGWLQALKFRTLPTSTPVHPTPPKEVLLHYVDELNAAKNRAYTVAIANSATLESALKKLPQVPEPAAR